MFAGVTLYVTTSLLVCNYDRATTLQNVVLVYVEDQTTIDTASIGALPRTKHRQGGVNEFAVALTRQLGTDRCVIAASDYH